MICSFLGVMHGSVCYLNLISTLGSDCGQLLITYNKPHRAASSTTIWPCLEAFKTKSDIDIELFGTYSTRAAAVASASGNKGLVDNILCMADLSEIGRNYKKPLLPQERNFGELTV